ncbi:putative peptidase; putative exported protein [Cupriavidus taiwanensis]|uniref:Peptidase putative exported protein n=1 Tax=Cupriavidus taiwanensis TaxID=164546 RepID=A0A375BGM1_9BURK|nr:peptidoglycan DD-metalloendopeptidase family protein [Cupriavidus taiwanensis]SOY44071.1 putative peptidase; putative exported protein [Cupriavidus taiwanensis]
MTKTRHDIEPARRRALGLLLTAATAALTAACGTTGGPVPDGYYRVERGDTLYSIARKHRRSVRDLTRWNSDITSPSQIEVGQLIRVWPPGAAAGGTTASSGTGQAVTDTPRVDGAAASRPPASSIRLQWPADGRVTAGFAPPASKGLSIAVPANGTVRAAAAGRAIHVGNLRGYGMLVIVKHNDDWLTVYGNLDQPLVSEGAQVSTGQDVGRMGANPSELHFEVRGNGKPVNPATYLPSRG